MADERDDTADDREAAGLRTLESAAGFREALLELLQGAHRQVCIYSENLCPTLYNDPRVTEALSAFARRSRYTDLQILVRDSETLGREFNRTHHLAQRLCSRIQLRSITPTSETPQQEFVLADGKQVLLREDRDQWLGIYDPRDRVRARRLEEVFRQEWERASLDPALRRLDL
ncbi:hypothetical protein [Microbulbifer yueqingensis]|uniref:DUF7931 domain-containing protein n=1 Tax=Microbulbifer yueqingensis TaxID=658219 RepID=A0A1G8ZRH2_9GAMM|nr:hypothetical protein [Microbulbifer yueqingensis]SDK16915.1 hypothetical protein SAMN05216212_1701 [Microbulbifer yueqingensis]